MIKISPREMGLRAHFGTGYKYLIRVSRVLKSIKRWSVRLQFGKLSRTDSFPELKLYCSRFENFASNVILVHNNFSFLLLCNCTCY